MHFFRFSPLYSTCSLLFFSCVVFDLPFCSTGRTLLGATGAHLLLTTVGTARRNFSGYCMGDCRVCLFCTRAVLRRNPSLPIHRLPNHYVPSPHHPSMSSSSKPSETSHMLSNKTREQRMALKQFAVLSMVTCVVHGHMHIRKVRTNYR